VNVRFLKPFDKQMLEEICNTHHTIITVEDGTVVGALFSEISEFIIEKKYAVKVSSIALPDAFIEHGDIPNLHKLVGFDVDSIINRIRVAAK
jgi:1-deoxy-D-xylulose-5-phosphate synthase